MPKPRSSGRKWSIRRSSSQMPPPLAGSSPAMMFSVVDFPQPDGPKSAMNSPLEIESVTSRSAVTPPNSRESPESLSSRKSAAWIAIRNSQDWPSAPAGSRDGASALSLLPPDLLVPATESLHHRLRIERRLERGAGDQLLVLRPA